jgi:hypothetical protein
VTANAILAPLTPIDDSRVVAPIFLNSLKNLFVAVDAFKLTRPSTKAVAGSAVRKAVQGTMSFRKRSR